MILKIREKVKMAREGASKFVKKEITDRFKETVSPISGRYSAGRWISNKSYTPNREIFFGSNVKVSKGRFKVI